MPGSPVYSVFMLFTSSCFLQCSLVALAWRFPAAGPVGVCAHKPGRVTRPPMRAPGPTSCPPPRNRCTFNVTNSRAPQSSPWSAGTLLGTWSSSTTTLRRLSLDFTVPGGDIYTITVTGPVNATSPVFPVNTPSVLYPACADTPVWF